MKLRIDHEEDKLEFKEKDKKVKLIESKGGHLIAQLELVGKWEDKDAIYLVENENEVDSEKAIRKIYKILNHKSKEQMHYAFRNAGKMNEEIRKKIDEVVDKCEICKKNSHSVALPKATDFNSKVVIDLKIAGDNYILWMVCACTRFIQGRVMKDENPESIIKALHR